MFNQVAFVKQAITVSVGQGHTLLEAARRAGIVIDTPCNGTGTCGKCRAKSFPPAALYADPWAFDSFTEAEQAAGWVLACQARVAGDVAVEIEASNDQGLKIVSESHEVEVQLRPWIRKAFNREHSVTEVFGGSKRLSSESGDTTNAMFGLSVDIGTTTLVTALIDLRDGREVATASGLNPQARHAQDVLSRIKLGSQPEGLRLLHEKLMEELNRQIAEVGTMFLDVVPKHIYEVVFSGNTTMLHLATHTNPSSLGKYPYTPALQGGCHVQASDIGLTIAPEGLVYLPPIMSAYVGADITSGILATSLATEAGVVLFVDIGTNGEMVLAVNGKLTATSTAAGPAFEGMNISCGMRANTGAIERVALAEGRVDIQTIGDADPVGLCGSGLLDAIGELAAHKGVDANGRFQFKDQSWPWKAQWEELDGKLIFRLAGPVYLSQKDVRQVQLAKAAVRAGIELLLKANNITPCQVDRVLIAGSFGFHLKTDSLIHLGLLPREFQNRVEFVGNTSKSGGRAFLLDHHTRDEMKAITQQVRVLELANDPAFEKTFIRSIAF